MKSRKTVIYDAKDQPVAVLLDWSTFRRLEEDLEDKALAARLNEVADERPLNRAAALRKYRARKAD